MAQRALAGSFFGVGIAHAVIAHGNMHSALVHPGFFFRRTRLALGFRSSLLGFLQQAQLFQTLGFRGLVPHLRAILAARRAEVAVLRPL